MTEPKTLDDKPDEATPNVAKILTEGDLGWTDASAELDAIDETSPLDQQLVELREMVDVLNQDIDTAKPNLVFQMGGDLPGLFGAIANAQGKIAGAQRESLNPFYSSMYADLATCWDAAREHLSGNGLFVVQSPSVLEPAADFSPAKDSIDTGWRVRMTTLLGHCNGGWIKGVCTVAIQDGEKRLIHKIGSAISYLRRYTFCALVGVAQKDDDGQTASSTEKITENEIIRLQELCDTVGLNRGYLDRLATKQFQVSDISSVTMADAQVAQKFILEKASDDKRKKKGDKK